LVLGNFSTPALWAPPPAGDSRFWLRWKKIDGYYFPKIKLGNYPPLAGGEYVINGVSKIL